MSPVYTDTRTTTTTVATALFTYNSSSLAVIVNIHSLKHIFPELPTSKISSNRKDHHVSQPTSNDSASM